MALSIAAMLLVAACGGPGQATPTALPAGLVRPVQPTPAYPASVREFTLSTAASSTAASPAEDVQPPYAAPAWATAVSAPAVALVMVQPPTALGIVAGGPASLMQQPGGALLATLPVGAALTVTGRSADGRHLAVFTPAGMAGWVAVDAVALFGADDLTIIAAPADLGPVATLIAQAMAPVDEQVRRFTAPQPAAQAPSVDGDGGPSPGLVVSDARLNVRAAPDTAAAVIRQLLPGDAVAVTGQSGDGRWLRIALAEGEGWVAAEFVELSVPGELAPPVRLGS